MTHEGRLLFIHSLFLTLQEKEYSPSCILVGQFVSKRLPLATRIQHTINLSSWESVVFALNQDAVEVGNYLTYFCFGGRSFHRSEYDRKLWNNIISCSEQKKVPIDLHFEC